MSNTRKARGRRVPPQRLQELAAQAACPDCDSEVVLLHQAGGGEWDWRMECRHDAECPQYQWRQRSGAKPTLILLSKDGTPLPPALIAEAAEAVAADGTVTRVAFPDAGDSVAPSWREREFMDKARGQP